MKNDKDVKIYFKETAEEFDDIYDNRGGLFKRIVNKVFRKGMYERVALTLQECRDDDKTILDIGCGSGRIAFLLAKKRTKIIGIDYSSEMIELANEYSKKYKNSTNIKFICCDFMTDFNNNELFDITLALGVFDYIKDPRLFLKKMNYLTKEKMIAYYPAKFAFQAPIRKVWLWKRNCPVYFYTKNELKRIYASIGITNYKIIKITAGYMVISNPSN